MMVQVPRTEQRTEYTIKVDGKVEKWGYYTVGGLPEHVRKDIEDLIIEHEYSNTDIIIIFKCVKGGD